MDVHEIPNNRYINEDQCIYNDIGKITIIKAERKLTKPQSIFYDRQKAMKEEITKKYEESIKELKSEPIAKYLRKEFEKDSQTIVSHNTLSTSKYCYITNKLDIYNVISEISKINIFSSSLKVIGINKYYDVITSINNTTIKQILDLNKPYYDKENNILYLRFYQLKDNWYKNLFYHLKEFNFNNIIFITDSWPLPNSPQLSNGDYSEYSNKILKQCEKIIVSTPFFNIQKLPKHFQNSFKNISSSILETNKTNNRGVYKIRSKFQIELYNILCKSSNISSEQIYNVIVEKFPTYLNKTCNSDLNKMVKKGIISQNINKTKIKGKKSMLTYYVTEENKILFNKTNKDL